MGEFIFITCLAILAVGMYFLTFDFAVSIIDKSGGATLFPRIIICLFLFFLLLRCIVLLKSPEERSKKFAFIEIFKGSKLVYLVLTFLYFILMPVTGFILSSTTYLSILISYLMKQQKGTGLAKKQILILIGCTCLTSCTLYYIFNMLLNIMLPEGVLGRLF